MHQPMIAFSLSVSFIYHCVGGWGSVLDETFILSYSLFLFYYLNNEAHDIHDGQKHEVCMMVHKLITDQQSHSLLSLKPTHLEDKAVSIQHILSERKIGGLCIMAVVDNGSAYLDDQTRNAIDGSMVEM
jgi:hypothetical protein